MKIIKQRDLKDCGVCSLASIIQNYGGYVSLERIRLDTKTTNNGTNALNIIEASKKYGFDAIGIKVPNLENDAIKLPAIAHLTLKNGYNHYVVIYKITKNKVIIMDPSKGKVVESKKDFYQNWTNVLLIFYPKRKITVFEKGENLLNLFLKIFYHEKKLFIYIIIFSIFLTIFTVIGSYYFQIMVEAITLNYHKSYLKFFVIVFGTALILKLIFNYIRDYLENYINKNIDCLLNVNFINHIFNLPLEVIVSRSAGEIMLRVNELANLKNLFSEIFISCLLDFMLMFISIPLLYNISSSLFLAFFLCLLVYFVIGLISSKLIFKKVYQNLEYESNYNNVLLENITMFNSIKNLNIVEKRLKTIYKSLVEFLFDSFKFSRNINTINNLKRIISDISFFIINTWGFYLVYKSKLNITELVTFNTLLAYFYNPLKNCIDSIPKYNFLKATYAKINDFLSVDIEKKEKIYKLLNNNIFIDKLSYSYNKENKIFDNYTLNIKSGSFVCLKGESGSGKSTLCKILDKYILDYTGNVFIGNENLKDINRATIRKNITYVNQNEALISDTIRENIILGRKIEEQQFLEICKICCIDKIVDNKIMRFNTTINNEKNNISGGEAQRIILARALLNKFEILILDEALSEVDYDLENKILANIKEKYKGKTIIYITHKNILNVFDKVITFRRNNELRRVTKNRL